MKNLIVFASYVFNNGFKIAWGVVEVSGTKTVSTNLPVLYTNRTTYQLFVSVIRSNASGSGVDVVYGYRVDGDTISVTHDYATTDASTYASWFTVGY